MREKQEKESKGESKQREKDVEEGSYFKYLGEVLDELGEGRGHETCLFPHRDDVEGGGGVIHDVGPNADGQVACVHLRCLALE